MPDRHIDDRPSLTVVGVCLLCILFLLSGCTQPVKPGQQTETYPADEPLSEEQQLRLQARELLEQAEDADSELERQQYRIQAVSLYIKARDKVSAQRLLDAVADNRTGDPAEEADINILYARIAINEKKRSDAERYIDMIEPVRRDQQIELFSLKADLDYLYGRYLHSVDRRTQLEQYYTDAEQIRQNHLRIWAALTAMPTQQLDAASASRPEVAGWMDLARVMRDNQHDIDGLENSLLDWGTRYPQHPANDSFLTELLDIHQQYRGVRQNIAIILPLQGNLETVAGTIRNGFLSAFYRNRTGTPPEIRFYDSSDINVSFDDLYKNAVLEGATHVIGPLDKRKVNQLMDIKSMDVPVLSLNYADSDATLSASPDGPQYSAPEYSFNDYAPGDDPTWDNRFQFGLSPEDEASQVAELAIQQDMTRAAVFYPDSDWGRRIKNAFNSHYRSLGGSVQTETDYATDTSDYRRPIRQLLNLDKSAIRHQRIENIISENTQSEPYRRQDIDMIFMAATSREARSIMPAFKFHRAGDVPVYSTSHVFTGTVDRDKDRDLDGLVFCDLPWLLEDETELKREFEQNWPEQKAYTRLFALGVDAYHLIYNLEYMQTFSDASYPGVTGEITLGANNRLSRKLLWARFIKGTPVRFIPEPAVQSPGPQPVPETQQGRTQVSGQL